MERCHHAARGCYATYGTPGTPAECDCTRCTTYFHRFICSPLLYYTYHILLHIKRNTQPGSTEAATVTTAAAATLAMSPTTTQSHKTTSGKLPKKFQPAVHDPIVAKGTKSLLDRFPVDRLTAEDVGFLKALDKQFAKYGSNVKIRVENVTTPASSGSAKKRTIDGELG